MRYEWVLTAKKDESIILEYFVLRWAWCRLMMVQKPMSTTTGKSIFLVCSLKWSIFAVSFISVLKIYVSLSRVKADPYYVLCIVVRLTFDRVRSTSRKNIAPLTTKSNFVFYKFYHFEQLFHEHNRFYVLLCWYLREVGRVNEILTQKIAQVRSSFLPKICGQMDKINPLINPKKLYLSPSKINHWSDSIFDLPSWSWSILFSPCPSWTDWIFSWLIFRKQKRKKVKNDSNFELGVRKLNQYPNHQAFHHEPCLTRAEAFDSLRTILRASTQESKPQKASHQSSPYYPPVFSWDPLPPL